METPKKNNARNTYLTLRECLKNEDYLKAQRIMEKAQKTYRKMLRDDIEPTDWDVLNP